MGNDDSKVSKEDYEHERQRATNLQTKLEAEEKQREAAENQANMLQKKISLETQRKRIRRLVPGESLAYGCSACPEAFSIGMFGEVGVGKSSFLRSVHYAMNETVSGCKIQRAPPNHEGGHTTRRSAMRVTKKLNLVDAHGIALSKWSTEEVKQGIIDSLEGRESVLDAMPDMHSRSKVQKIHAMVLVFSATSPFPPEPVTKLLRHITGWQGRYPIAVVTKVDHPKAETQKILDTLMAAGISSICQVANVIEGKAELTLGHEENILNFVEECFVHADCILEYRDEIE